MGYGLEKIKHRAEGTALSVWPEGSRQRTEVRRQMSEDRGVEVGSRTAEVGPVVVPNDGTMPRQACGSRNKKMRPKEFGSKLGRWNAASGLSEL